jgi:hypothetical protein
MALKKVLTLMVRFAAPMLVLCLIARPAAAQIDYSSDLAALFAADYQDTGSGPQPQNNPFGDWRFLAQDGTTTNLVSKPGGLTASGQAGWETNPPAGGPWTYFRAPWQPGVTVVPGVAGHAPMEAVWTAPAAVNAGGVSISGSIEQMFEDARRLRLSIFKNGAANASFTVDALPPIVNGVLLQRVDFGAVNVPVVAGDTLKFRVDGSGTGGNGVPTFGAWNVILSENVPEPASAGMLVAGVTAMLACRRRACLPVR